MSKCGSTTTGMVTGVTRNYNVCMQDVTKVIATKKNHLLFGLTIMIAKGRTVFLSDTTTHELPSPEDLAQIAIRNLFAPHGTVEKLSLISDRDTGQPRGFGFVEMSSADASRAMQALNGQDFNGRPLKINEAQDKPRTGGGGGKRY